MFNIFNFILLLGVCILCSEALPATQNYTQELLRFTKATEIKAYLNEEKPPCENFYKFACGKWSKLHPAPPRGKSSKLDELKPLYWRKCADMLASDSRVDSGLDTKLKNFYESCLSTGKIDRLGLEYIMNEVDFKGGWPKVLNSPWYELDYDWLKVVAKVRRNLGVNIMIGLNVVPDFKEKDMHRIMVGAPEFYLSQQAYLIDDEDNERLRTAYTISIQTQLQRYFPDMSEQWSNEVADQVVHVERRLAAGLARPDLTVQQKSRLRYTADLKAAYGSYVDINRYLNLIFNSTFYAQVYESPIDYFSNLVDVIRETPKLTIANYTMWKVLNKFDLERAHFAKSSNFCVNKVMEYFPEALENMFARNYHTMQLSNDLQSVWSDIKKTFRDELHNSPKLTWIATDTKQKFIEKLEAMEFELSTANTAFAEQIQKVLIRKTNYYQNLISIWQWQSALNLAKINERPSEPEEKYELPHYDYETNKIEIPITFLQSRFLWDSSYPHALLYSTLGYLLAQEMFKAFDSQGRKYDKYGNSKIWMDTITEYTFDDKAKCYVEQYSKYKFPNWVRTDEKKLTNTYISDNAALSIAYKAYTQWWENVANNEAAKQESLPLLDKYSRTQLFFIGFAQLWCADYAPDIEKFEELPERWRVIGALANLNDFARAYQCDLGNKMNPEQKCIFY
ncbi:neprilysin-like 15 [Cochliomyia hominivorax]